MDFLISGITSITPQQIVMYVIGAVLIWLAINKDLEPVLLLPLGFGAILVNLPESGVLNQTLAGIGETNGIIEWLFDVGIEASEAMPLLLFIGIGAMIDFGPLLSNPKLFLFGAAAQFGILQLSWLPYSLALTSRTPHPSVSSARPTAPLPFWYRRCWDPITSGPLPWWHTRIWPSYPLSSRSLSVCSPPRKNAASIWNIRRSMFPEKRRSFSPSWLLS